MPSLIDTYIAELAGALRGPARAKADLLTEARDGLVDAADAFQHGGADPVAAERLAVRDFGAVAEIAPGYQAELGLAQGRRTALLIMAVFGAQPFVWGYAFRWATDTSAEDSRTGFRIADALVELLGEITLAAAMLALLAYWVGMRYSAVRSRITRVTGVFALIVSFLFAGLATFLTLFGAKASVVIQLINLVWTVAFVLCPVTWIAVYAKRCLTMSCPAPR